MIGGVSETSAVSDEHAALCRRVVADLDALFARDWQLRDLVTMQARLKLVLMACAPAAQKEIGRLVAAGKSLPKDALAAAYRRQVTAVLAREPTRGRHVNALEHAFGYFRERADIAERSYLHDGILSYARGQCSLVDVRHALAAAADRHAITYLQQQTYLS